MRAQELTQSWYWSLRGKLSRALWEVGDPDVVIGLSGGIDSALTASLAVDALGAERVQLLFLPNDHRVDSEHSRQLAWTLADQLGASLVEQPIGDAVDEAARALVASGPGQAQEEGLGSVTQQNLSARLRMTLLMGWANEESRLMLATGNKSELAMGYATLYGDLAGAFAPLGDLYKTDIYRLVRRVPELSVIPEGIVQRPPSAELFTGQEDEQEMMPYALLDALIRQFKNSADYVGPRDPRIVEDYAQIRAEYQADPQRLAMRQEWVQNCMEANAFKRRQAPPAFVLQGEGE